MEYSYWGQVVVTSGRNSWSEELYEVPLGKIGASDVAGIVHELRTNGLRTVSYFMGDVADQFAQLHLKLEVGEAINVVTRISEGYIEAVRIERTSTGIPLRLSEASRIMIGYGGLRVDDVLILSRLVC